MQLYSAIYTWHTTLRQTGQTGDLSTDAKVLMSPSPQPSPTLGRGKNTKELRLRGIETGIQDAQHLIKHESGGFFNKLYPPPCAVNGLELFDHDVPRQG